MTLDERLVEVSIEYNTYMFLAVVILTGILTALIQRRINEL